MNAIARPMQAQTGRDIQSQNHRAAHWATKILNDRGVGGAQVYPTHNGIAVLVKGAEATHTVEQITELLWHLGSVSVKFI